MIFLKVFINKLKNTCSIRPVDMSVTFHSDTVGTNTTAIIKKQLQLQYRSYSCFPLSPIISKGYG